MKIILSVDAIAQPLTGIGRYTLELAKGLNAKLNAQQHNLDAVKYYSRGKWITDINALTQINANNNTNNSSTNSIKSLAKKIVRSNIARQAYRKIAPYISQYRLNRLSDHIYHGTNFYVPKFSGKSIATIHDLSIFKYPQFHPSARVKFMEKEIKHTLENASLIITDSEYTKQEIADYFTYAPSKIIAIPLGIDENFTVLDSQNIALNQFLHAYKLQYKKYILCVATIEPRKNIETLLNAYEKLPEYVKQEYPLVLVGSKGWNSNALHTKIQKLMHTGYVHYLGYVPEQNLPLLINGAKIFVFPSIYEGFGLPVLEAMACGVPVITSNTSSILEVSGGNDASIVLDPYNVDAFEASIIHLIYDAALYENKVTKAMAHAKKYTWAQTVNNTLAAYKLLIQ
jgi:glycosyltransferase involved in cell wall biosynthesis